MNDPIDAILTTEIDAQGPGAAVAIVKDGSLLYCNGHWLANIEWGMPISIALSKDLPLEFEPGTQFKYTNYSYILLGQIIEAVSGMSYEAFVYSQIFQPLGMKHSNSMSNESIIPHRASGYVRAQQGYQHAAYINMQIEYAAGELGSTVEDLVRWDTALREYRLLDQATQERMYTPAQLLNGQRTDYGFGWGVVDYYGHRVAEHLGVFDGFSAFIARFLDDATTIIILSNLADLDTEKLTRRISSLVLDIPLLTRIPVTVDEALLDKASGTYDFYGGHIEVVRDGDKLMFRGPLTSQLLPIDESTFYALVDEEVEVRFENDQGQSFQRFTFRTPLFSFKAKRIPKVSS